MDGEAYEGWYFLRGSYALEPLAELVLSDAGLKRLHDGAARMARNGKGGLYRPSRGPPASVLLRYGIWPSKPSGMSYEEFFAKLPAEKPVEQATRHGPLAGVLRLLPFSHGL